MPLFQKSVLNKYLKTLDSKTLEEAYSKYSEHFLDTKMQQEIRDMKEEEYQDGFLDDLFVNVLGYIKRPKEGYNLIREKKNETNGKKADGAILKDNTPLAVIELKGTDTTDLDKITNQAFGYKNNNTDCVYVVTSNFEKLRFYIHNAVEHIEFNLFNLSKEDFEILWLCLQVDSLLHNIPLKAKEESIVVEENITKQLYKDYSTFKNELWQNVCKNLPDKDQLTLFKKSQKLLDRFLFIFFAEDGGLLPPNSITRMVERYEQLIELDAKKPLYEIFKQYFDYINIGRKGKSPQDDIFAYNGGLFLSDEVLDEFIIDDDLLKKHILKLTAYDFQSDIDVNILGHIFENSLNDIENVTAQLEGQEIDKSKTKRKKDGVFYTPKYITKYIVENTVGKLCEEKKSEFGVIDEEYAKGRRNRKKETIKKLDKSLKQYRNWLLNITICDPACGSGAFLNQALEFLMDEHHYIDSLESQLLGYAFEFPGVENHILEKNIYGVDINEESVEIAKLSLWLRTAQRGRKLTSLNNNIKCGNSLIDDPEIAGAKAFNWEREFPKVFEKGGFDVIIGNPPYGAELPEKHKSFLEQNFKTFEYQVNTYVVFYERGVDILMNGGCLGFITPATFTSQHYFKKLRNYFQQYRQIAISKYFYEVFEDADIGDSVSWIIQKLPNNNQSILIQLCNNKEESMLFPTFKEYDSIVNSLDGTYLLSSSGLDLNKFYNNSLKLDDISNIIVGIKPYQTGKGEPKQTKEIVKSKIFTSTKKENETYIQCVIGKDFYRYGFIQVPEMHLSYGKWLAEPRGAAPFFDDEKIILRQTADSLIGTIDSGKRINLNNVYNIGKTTDRFNLKYILALLNGKLLNIIYQNISQEKGRTFAEVKKVNLAKLPIKDLSKNEQLPFVQLADSILNFHDELFKINLLVQQLLKSKFSIEILSKKLQKWYELEFSEFIMELEKARKNSAKENGIEYTKLSLSEEADWMQYFNEQKEKAQELKQKIDKTDKEIDQMVYELYGLTQEEIEIVENS